MSCSPSIARRTFFGQCGSALLAAGVWTQSNARVRAEPNSRLRIAAIGVGSRGETNVIDVRDEQIVALCDVDERHLTERGERFPDARRYRDYRELFDRETLDAVVISSPDHTHAHAALLAMEHGWHVYCEKPLATTIAEVRRMAQAARRKRVITQTGNQHHSTRGYQRVIQLVQAGVLGEVQEVHSWTDRPFWPQGLRERPAAKPVPRRLAWDLWLGTAAERPYGDGYHPINWRGFWDFGTGALGDYGPHLLDPLFAALRLTLPTRVTAESSPVTAESPPESSIVKFTFPARGDLAPVLLTWYDGGRQPPSETTGVKQAPRNGSLLIGSRARLFVPELGGMPRLFGVPGAALPDQPPEPQEPVSTHFEDWLGACRLGRAARCDFDYGATLTETCLLGNLALRTGREIRWDAGPGRPLDLPAATPLLDRKYRAGWELPPGAAASNDK